MGWSHGGEVFTPIARKLEPGAFGLGPADRTEILAVVIKALQDRDWDDESDTLAEFADDPAVVAAFRACGVIIYCDDHVEIAASSTWCRRERGPAGHADGKHEDWKSRTWPVTGGQG